MGVKTVSCASYSWLKTLYGFEVQQVVYSILQSIYICMWTKTNDRNGRGFHADFYKIMFGWFHSMSVYNTWYDCCCCTRQQSPHRQADSGHILQSKSVGYEYIIGAITIWFASYVKATQWLEVKECRTLIELEKSASYRIGSRESAKPAPGVARSLTTLFACAILQ